MELADPALRHGHGAVNVLLALDEIGGYGDHQMAHAMLDAEAVEITRRAFLAVEEWGLRHGCFPYGVSQGDGEWWRDRGIAGGDHGTSWK
jgi:hypothetical protein